MPITILVKLTRIGNSLRLTVPKDVLRILEWKEGDMLEVGTADKLLNRLHARRLLECN
jgi:antitoxin component of MazEF toxin-antitoxin module